MKYRLIIILVMLLGKSYGQAIYGVKGGLNGTNTRNIGNDNTTPRLGYNFGLLAQIPVGKQFFINPELLYSLKGSKFPATGYNGSGTLSLNYICLPVLAAYRLTDWLMVQAGPEFGYLLNAKSNFDGSNHDVSKNFQNFDMALDGGLAFRIAGGLGIDIRYSHGFELLAKGIITDNMGNAIGGSEEKYGSNRGGQIGLTYSFSKK